MQFNVNFIISSFESHIKFDIRFDIVQKGWQKLSLISKTIKVEYAIFLKKKKKYIIKINNNNNWNPIQLTNSKSRSKIELLNCFYFNYKKCQIPIHSSLILLLKFMISFITTLTMKMALHLTININSTHYGVTLCNF